MGSLNDFVFSIGISKRLDTDVNYHEVKEDPLLMDRMFFTAPYRLKIASNLPNFLTTTQRDELKHHIEIIIKEANQKRSQLYDLMSQNPYLPYHKVIAPYMYACYFSLIGRFLRIPIFSVCMAVSVFLLTGHAFIFIFMICFVFACLLDFFTCRLLSGRGSVKEQEWLNTMMKAHPDYNTVEIDRELKNRLEQLSLHVMNNYPNLQIDYCQALERHSHLNHQSYHYDDKFMLKIRRKVLNVNASGVAIVRSADASLIPTANTVVEVLQHYF